MENTNINRLRKRMLLGFVLLIIIVAAVMVVRTVGDFSNHADAVRLSDEAEKEISQGNLVALKKLRRAYRLSYPMYRPASTRLPLSLPLLP